MPQILTLACLLAVDSFPVLDSIPVLNSSASFLPGLLLHAQTADSAVARPQRTLDRATRTEPGQRGSTEQPQTQAYVRYGQDACYASLHQDGAAIEPCIDALDRASQDGDTQAAAELRSALAIIYAKRGQLPNARDLMDQALLDDAGNINVVVNNGNLAIYEGNYEQALLEFDRVLAVASPAAVYLNRSIALRALGRYADAKRDYESFLALRSAPSLQSSSQPGSDEPGQRYAPDRALRSEQPRTRAIQQAIPIEDRSPQP